jgi:hypothetical protein
VRGSDQTGTPQTAVFIDYHGHSRRPSVGNTQPAMQSRGGIQHGDVISSQTSDPWTRWQTQDTSNITVTTLRGQMSKSGVYHRTAITCIRCVSCWLLQSHEKVSTHLERFPCCIKAYRKLPFWKIQFPEDQQTKLHDLTLNGIGIVPTKTQAGRHVHDIDGKKCNSIQVGWAPVISSANQAEWKIFTWFESCQGTHTHTHSRTRTHTLTHTHSHTHTQPNFVFGKMNFRRHKLRLT